MGSYADCAAGARERALFELLRQRLVKPFAVGTLAAGLESSMVVPAGSAWELLGYTGRLTTSAVVANRVVSLQVRDADNNAFGQFYSARVIAASAAGTYTYGAGQGASTQNSGTIDPLPSPPLLLLPGWIVRVATVALDAGDQWSAVSWIVREWSLGDVNQQADWIESRMGSWRNR